MRWQMQCVTGKSRLHKRSGPSISYKIVGYWYNGDTFVATDVKTVGNYTWYKIEGTSYWSCGKKGSSTYLKKIKDLDPPAPVTPPTPIVETPKQDAPIDTSPEPSWQGKDYGNYQLGSGWGYSGVSDWYASSEFNYGSWDIVSDDVINEKLRCIRYNMDIAYMNKSDIKSDYTASTGFYSDLQAKINNSFNRNKTCFPDYHLNKTFAYVFFTRPDLNICQYSGGKWSLTSQCASDPKYNYLFENNSWSCRSLVSNGNPNHKFLVLLSNEAKSFEVEDKVLKTVEHGETFTGAKVYYGRTDHESNSAGEMSIRYIDNVNLDIYKMHEVWTDYINNVSRGRFSPKRTYITNRILDYACSCYYFLCGPDGSTILYWQKLTGVFPVNTGENAFSWDSGTLLAKPEINIKYMYAMKTPLDVSHLHEFNKLVSNGSLKNIKKGYDNRNCAIGSTLTHAPYIATTTNADGKLFYKLVWLND